MRKILASALCLLMLCASALAETYTVDVYGSEESPAYAILLSDDGTLLTPIQTCSSIYQLTPRGTPDAEKLFSVTPVNVDIAYTPELAEELLYDMDSIHVALMNGEGRLLTGFDYDGLDYVNGAVIFTLPDDARHCGAMDAAGNVIVEPVYAALRPRTSTPRATSGTWACTPATATSTWMPGASRCSATWRSTTGRPCSSARTATSCSTASSSTPTPSSAITPWWRTTTATA